MNLSATRTRIYALVILVALVLVGLRGWSLARDRAELLAAAEQDVAASSRAMAFYVARVLDSADLLTQEVEQAVAARGGLGAFSTAELQTLLAREAGRIQFPGYLLVSDAEGRPAAFSDRTRGLTLDFRDRAWFRAHRDGGAVAHVGTALRSRVSGEVIYTFSRRLERNGDFDGVVQAAIRPAFSRADQAPDSDGVVQLWSRDGRLILTGGMTFDAVGNLTTAKSYPLAERPYEPEGSTRIGDRMIAWRTAEGWPVVAVTERSRARVLATWREEVFWTVLLIVSTVGAAALLAKVAADSADRDRAARTEHEAISADLARALAERELLLREIHHRVKNSVQMAGSLLVLQARKLPPSEARAALEQTRDRLRAISMVHESLYKEDVTKVSLAEYLRALSAELAYAHGADERGVVVHLDVEPLPLRPETATPVGLSVAEAVTNAFKHAFAPEGGGSLWIEAKRAGGDVVVSVRDDGRGLKGRREPDPSSLGMTLLRALAGQLGGTFSLTDDSARGTVFCLVFPLTPGLLAEAETEAA